jgi:hypothetical protein
MTTPEGASLSQGRGRCCGRAEMTDAQQARADGVLQTAADQPITVSGESVDPIRDTTFPSFRLLL